MIDKKAVGKRIAAIRKSKGMKQSDLLGKNRQSTISTFERGILSDIETLDEIADALGVSIKAFLFEEDFAAWDKDRRNEAQFSPLPPLPFDEADAEVVAKIREVTEAINRQGDRLAAILTEISKEL